HDGLAGNVIRCLAEDRQGDLWVGTEGARVCRLYTDHWTRFEKAEGLPGKSVLALSADSDGVIWAGTPAGLARFQTGKWIPCSDRCGPANLSIGYLLDDEQGSLWVGSNAGLLRVPKKEVIAATTGDDSVPFRSYGKRSE